MPHSNKTIGDIIGNTPVIPVIQIYEIEQAVPLATALLEGGLNVLEVTLRTPHAWEAIWQIKDALPDAIIGVGTITTPEQFARAYNAGAAFAVSPGCTDSLVKIADEIPLPLLPGIATISEAMKLREHGYEFLKLFPAETIGGCGFLKALHSPIPDLKFCPTGGINLKNAPDYLALPNVVCIGGSWMVPKSHLDSGNWQQVTTDAKAARALR